MIRILLVTVRSDFGGGPRHVNQLINALPKECIIYMAYPENGNPYAEIWKKDGRIKDTIYIPYRKFSIIALFKLRCFVRRNNIDIIHSHGNGAGLYSRLLRLLGVKTLIVHTFHGISGAYSSRFKYILSFLIGKMLAPWADAYIAVSKGEKTLGVKRGFCVERNCMVIYNGVVDEGLKTSNFEKREIVTLSRYDYSKNMYLCLDIVRLMKSDNVKFVWVGDGEDFAKMKNAIKRENLPVDMVGFQARPMEFLKRATVYLSTSRFEGLPYALIEATSIGLPIVATDVKGNNEVAINGENGITFKTPEEGAAALRYILNDKSVYDQMSNNGRKIFEANFTIEEMIGNIVKLYQTLLR